MPTPIKLLVPDYPSYIQYTDACGIGTGGIISSGLKPCLPIVWKFEWPENIKTALVTNTNPSGSISINDLELAGMVLGWLVMEYTIPNLAFCHIGMFCDNTSAITWAHKGSSSKSIPAARLLRFLYLRQRTKQTSSILPIHIAGEDNTMADISSRAFNQGKFFEASNDLLTYFNSHFPLSQNTSWTEFHLSPKLTTRVISCLLGEQCQLESLIRLPKLGKGTGAIGAIIQANAKLTHTYEENQKSSNPSSLPASLQGSGRVLTETDMKSKFHPSRTHWRPSPRPLNWQENTVPSTKQRASTYFLSKGVSRPSEERILHQHPNWPSQ